MRLRNEELESYFDGAHRFKVCHCLCGLQSHTFAGVLYCTVEEVQASMINELRRPIAVSRTYSPDDTCAASKTEPSSAMPSQDAHVPDGSASALLVALTSG